MNTARPSSDVNGRMNRSMECTALEASIAKLYISESFVSSSLDAVRTLGARLHSIGRFDDDIAAAEAIRVALLSRS